MKAYILRQVGKVLPEPTPNACLHWSPPLPLCLGHTETSAGLTPLPPVFPIVTPVTPTPKVLEFTNSANSWSYKSPREITAILRILLQFPGCILRANLVISLLQLCIFKVPPLSATTILNFTLYSQEWAQISQQPSFKRMQSWATVSMPSDVFYAPTGTTWGTNFLSCSVAKSWPTFATPMDCGRPGLPVPHHFLEFAQVHVHWISDAIQTSHPLSPSFPSAFNLSQHQGLFQWISSSHQVTKVLEFH